MEATRARRSYPQDKRELEFCEMGDTEIRIPAEMIEAASKLVNEMLWNGVAGWIECRPIATAVLETFGPLIAKAERERILRAPVAENDYLKIYRERWAEIVEDADGTIDVDAVARELADYDWLISNTSLAFDSVTGGRISKPNTLASEVTQAVEEHIADLEGQPS